MTGTIVGIIVCVSMIVCGLGCYFIGRMAGMEWVLEHTVIEVIDDDTTQNSGDEATE